MLPPYAELHCLSNFSFLRGASHPEELVQRAAKLGYAALAITDECSLAGVVRAHVAAKEAGLRLLIGSEFRLSSVGDEPGPTQSGLGPKIVLLATNRHGYGNLSELITLARRRADKGEYELRMADLDAGLPDCLALLVPDAATASIRSPHSLSHATWLTERFPGRAWIAAELLCGPDDRARLLALRALSRASGLPLVAAGDVHMHVRSRRRMQDALTAVRVGRPVAECGHALFPSGERHLRPRLRLANLYPADLIEESVSVASRCTFSLDELRYEYPEEVVPAGSTAAQWLRELTEQGLALRFPAGVPAHVRGLVEHELALITELRYEYYFLTVHDIVRFARERHILCQGRGSAANSAVCYALGITEVDPGRMSVLFERFISRERNEPPDIDVDFEHQRREEVIQYLYAKYGRERAALAATVICYRPKSALRDAGRALGLDTSQLERIAGAIAWWDDRHHLGERLREAGFDPDAPAIRLLMRLASALIGFPRHLSQHVGGFVISRGPLSRLVPVENASMPDRTVIQWDKDDLDALGLLKVDVLALGMLSAIRRALDMVGGWQGKLLRMQDIPAEDADVYRMIQRADTVGVFQIESRAQMSMLPRLKPATFYDLVVEVAIVRPGPIQGGMVHPYLRRRQKLEPVVYPSEAVRGVLERTLGVPIFQEQVMQLAVVAAGFSPGEADRLRRSMAAWRRKGGLEHFERQLKDGMAERGYAAEFAERIFQQILGFGEYGFPESHAASFALLVYVSAWIKHHHPAAFLAALVNSQPMGFYAPSQLLQDARRHGVPVLAVDATVSGWDCALEPCPGTTHANEERIPAVRLGLRMVKGLSEDGAQRLVQARAAGPFTSVEELARRATLDARDLKCLAAADALAPLAGHRRGAYWAVAGVDTRAGLLREAPLHESAASLEAPGEGEELVADYASLGLTLGRHPLALLRSRLASMRYATAESISALPHGSRARAAGIVTGRQRPDTASGVVFVTLEDETGQVNVVVWRSVTDAQRRELLGARLMGVQGVIERDGDVVHLVARKLEDNSTLLGRLLTSSRDFH